MNTGVGDAIDLGWKLAATLQGWGGPNLLASYEIERRQIGERIIGASRYAFLGRRKWREQYRPNIRERDAGGAGDARRADARRRGRAAQEQRDDRRRARLSLRRARRSSGDEPGGPEHRFREYVPTTWPGARLPHVWLDDGTAVQDRCGDAYVLLRLGRTHADTSALEHALRERRAPLQVLSIDDDCARDVYGCDLILLRPDLHVAWRGNAPPPNPNAARGSRDRTLTQHESQDRRLQSHLPEAILRAAAGSDRQPRRGQALAPHPVPARSRRALPHARGIRPGLSSGAVAVGAADRIDQPRSADHDRSRAAGERFDGRHRCRRIRTGFPGSSRRCRSTTPTRASPSSSAR